MTHSSGEAWALDDGHRGRVGDHTAHGFSTDLAGLHVPHAAGTILGCEPTELCLAPQICYESYSAVVFCSPAAGSKARICIRPLPASDWEG